MSISAIQRLNKMVVIAVNLVPALRFFFSISPDWGRGNDSERKPNFRPSHIVGRRKILPSYFYFQLWIDFVRHLFEHWVLMQWNSLVSRVISHCIRKINLNQFSVLSTNKLVDRIWIIPGEKGLLWSLVRILYIFWGARVISLLFASLLLFVISSAAVIAIWSAWSLLSFFSYFVDVEPVENLGSIYMVTSLVDFKEWRTGFQRRKRIAWVLVSWRYYTSFTLILSKC